MPPKSTKLGFSKSPGLFEKTLVFFKKAQWAGLFFKKTRVFLNPANE